MVVLFLAFVDLTLPLTALHATLTGSHMQLSWYWLKVTAATLVAFTLATLLASALGALLAVALQSVIPTLTHVWGIPSSGATVSFGCPRDVANGFVALQNDGKLVCSANGTTFVLDDMAKTFVTASKTQTFSHISEQVVQVTESLFPASLVDAFIDGNVLSLVVGGLVLGVALTGSFLEEKRKERDDAVDCHPFHEEECEQKKDLVILQLVTQAEAVGCRALSWLQAYLPLSAAFMISSVLLQTSAFPFTVDSGDTVVATAVLALLAVLLLALVLDVVVMILLTTVLTRSNPFAFLEHLLPAQLLAISSGSSIVALPATVSAVVASKRVSPALAFIVCSTSTVLNQTGAALYLSASTLFVLSAAALDMTEDEVIASQSTSTVAAMVFTNVLVTSVISPLPGGSKTAVLATTLSAVFGVSTGLRAVLVAFLAALEWVTGPYIACVNITNNALIVLVIAHYFEGQVVAETEGNVDEAGAVAHESPVQALRQVRVQDMADENWI
ncbi:hypothetical protein KXD40_003430 [Peronospora effusa]|uniref:Amino acid transporter n=1 Tax=Peronospora effusa TaxID=542832 RepID=A0A3M6VDV9_9STRA|nr:hypothetical protein DD238_005763 [Peronospora effusa]RQM15852.1 hypothetical protein DD237_005863 [Peronospora effusa]UIZ22870.1 hypothetical protein KXD40_003430 [Peronospora effusa]CAI5724746.1 unnamed protein product [Peronospora effusa]